MSMYMHEPNSTKLKKVKRRLRTIWLHPETKAAYMIEGETSETWFRQRGYEQRIVWVVE